MDARSVSTSPSEASPNGQPNDRQDDPEQPDGRDAEEGERQSRDSGVITARGTPLLGS